MVCYPQFFSTPLHNPSSDRFPKRRSRRLYSYATDNPAILNWLLQNGADLNARDKSGQTPLAHAAGSATLSAVELLFAYDARVDNNALHRVVRRRRGHGSRSEKIPILRCLLDHGADVNAREDCLERNGKRISPTRRARKAKTPLDEAVERGDQEVIQFLVENGARMGEWECAEL
jgi:ankyrin repeat protein